MSLVLIAALVLAIGVSLGLSGYGGFLIPALLVAVLHMGTRDAVAHGLLSFVLPGIVGAWLYWRQENRPSWYLTLLLCVGTVPGVLVGRLVSVSVADVTLQVLLGAVVLVSGLTLLLRRRPGAGPPAADGAQPPPARRRLPGRLATVVAVAGFLGGLAAVVAGVGGPLITVPILMTFGLDLAPLVGAALLNSVVVSVLGAVSLIGAVSIHPLTLAVVTVAQLAGVPVGVWLQRRVKPARLLPVIAAVSAITGVGLVYAALNHNGPAPQGRTTFECHSNIAPPSTLSEAPYTNEAACEQRNTAAAAMSAGWPIRPSGSPAAIRSLSSAESPRASGCRIAASWAV